MRLFVAIPLPDEIRTRLQMLQSGLSAARWVKPENLHLTLRFIGEVDGGLASDIDATLLALRGEAFELRLDGLGTFGEGWKLRVLWAGVAADERLALLQAKIERTLQATGLDPEGRKFKPHVTLARFNGGAPPRIENYLGSHIGFQSQSFAVDRFVLYSSFLSHGGPIYCPEAEYPLTAPL